MPTERTYGGYTLDFLSRGYEWCSAMDIHVVSALVAHIRELKAALSSCRETNTRLNRRSQEADAAAADAKRCLDELAKGTEKGTPWCSGSMGRALLAWHSSKQDERIKELEAANAALTAEKCKIAAEAASYLGQLLEVTAERDARVVLPEMKVGERYSIYRGTEDCQAYYTHPGYSEDCDSEECGCNELNAYAVGPTPAAALEALRTKMENKQ